MPPKDGKIQERSEVLASLQEIVADIIAELDLQSVLQKAVERAAELIGADIVTIHIYDPIADEVHAAAGYGLLDIGTFRDHKPGRGKVALSIASRGEPLIAGDVSTSELAGPFATREGVQSAAGFPLKVGDKVIGVLFVNYREPHRFESAEVETIVSFGNLAAIAIDNARLLQQERTLRQQAETLREASRAISSTLALREVSSALIFAPELKEVAERILDELGKVIKYCKASLQLIRGDIREMIAYRDFSKQDTGGWLKPAWVLPLISQDPLIRRVVSSKQPLVLSETSEDPDWKIHPETSDVKSWVGIPLICGEEMIGLLTLDHDQPGYYKDAVKDLVTPFCSQASIVMYNAYLLADLQRQIKGHQALNKIGTALAGTLDEEEILKRVARSAADTLDCTHCSVFYLEDGKLVVAASEGNRIWSLPSGRTFKLGQGVAGWVAQKGQPALVPNVLEDERFERGWSKPQPDPQSLVVVPVFLNGEVYGVISVEQDRVSAFDEQDQQLLETLALQTSQAIRNARLYGELKERIQDLETLNEAGREISRQLNIDQFLETLLDMVNGTLNCAHSTLFMVDQAGDLVPRVRRGAPLEIIANLRFRWGEGLAGWVAQHRQSLIVPDVNKDARSLPGRTGPAGSPHSMLLAPLLLPGDKVAGVISADKDEIDGFDENDELLLTTLAAQAAVAYENIRLLNDAQRRIRDLEIGNEVVKIISTKLGTEVLLQTIVSEIAEKLECTHCTIFFPQEEDGEVLLVPQVTRGERPQVITRRFKLDEGLAGWVFQQGKSLILADARNDPRFSPARDVKDRPRSMLVAPVKVGDQTIGVISADQDELGWFSESDRRLVDTLAQQVGIAFQRAVALRLLQDIGNRIISARDVDEILQQIVSGVIKLTNTTSSVIYLISEDGKSVVRSFQYPPDFDHPEPRIDKEEGFTRQVIATGEVLVIPDTHKNTQLNPALRDRVRSMIAIPLKLEQKVIGVLYLNATDLHDFTDTEVSLLSTLASQAAIVIEKARLFQELSERAVQLERLQEVTATISAKPADLDELLHLIVDRLSDILPEASYAIRLYDSKADRFRPYVATDNTLEDIIARDPRPEGTSRYVVQTKAPRYLKGDALGTPTDGGPPVRKEILEQGVKAVAYLPLISEEDVVGILYADWLSPHRFSENDRRILELFAHQAAIAIENARLFEQLRQEREERVETIREIGFGITAGTDLDEILGSLLQKTISLMKEASFGQICLLDEENGKLKVRAIYGDVETEIKELEIGEGIVGWVAQSKQPYLVGDVEDDLRFVRHLAGTRSELAVPLFKGTQVIGVLNVEHPQLNAFTQDDIPLLEAIASQVVIALENAQLFERIQELRVLELETLSQLGDDLAALERAG